MASTPARPSAVRTSRASPSGLPKKRKVEALTANQDVFGNGRVMVLRAPCHTPGHSVLLVRLKETGPVLLSGDAVHCLENDDYERVPGFNFDRAQSIASIQRMKQISANLEATVIIQHDPRDIGKRQPSRPPRSELPVGPARPAEAAALAGQC